jgi:hypothetical protein
MSQTEIQLIERAKLALNRCHWEIGECAYEWTEKYARGRTDVDFGQQIGMSGDQVYQRRRVYQTFGDVYQQYTDLAWSHFYVALNWDDAAECLQWAQDLNSSVAEMKAWRRANRGEDLSKPPFDDLPPEYLSDEKHIVRDPNDFDMDGEDSERYAGDMVASGAPRMNDEPYTPFRNDARGSAPKGQEEQDPAHKPIALKEAPTGPKLMRKVIKAMEISLELLTPGAIKQLKKEDAELKEKMLELATQLQERVQELAE